MAQISRFLSREACAERVCQKSMRSGAGVGQSAADFGFSLRREGWPHGPVSNRGFFGAFLTVRPIAITSPTDFIGGGQTVSSEAEFSNAKRGILVTTYAHGRPGNDAGVRRPPVMSLRTRPVVKPTAMFGCYFGNWEARAVLDANAEERLTRGFISITIVSPFSGVHLQTTCSSHPCSRRFSRNTANEVITHDFGILCQLMFVQAQQDGVAGNVHPIGSRDFQSSR